jgi:hypothetical protein
MKAKDFVWVLVLAGIVAVSFMMASRRSGTAPAMPTEGRPVAVQPVDGGNLHRVTLSAQAAERLGIETAVMGAEDGDARLAATGRRGGRTVVPYSAMLYDARGDTWVYTNPEPLVFVRERVSVESIDGNQVVLSNGLPAGTTIVTVGGAELLAAELGH